jgi:hypothetical protein
MLAAAFPSGALPAGDYLLKVEGASGAAWEVLARYRLRVTHRPPDSPAR